MNKEKRFNLVEYLQLVRNYYNEVTYNEKLGLCYANFEIYRLSGKGLTDIPQRMCHVGYYFLLETLREHKNSLKVAYRYSSKNSIMEITDLREDAMSYYFWNPNDRESRLKFMDEMISELKSTQKIPSEN